MSYGIAITTYTGPRLGETLASLPSGVPYVVISTRDPQKPLAWAWNAAVEEICGRQGLDTVVICNDDIILKPNTGSLLDYALTTGAAIEQRPHPNKKIVLVSAYNVHAVDRQIVQPDGTIPPYPVGEWVGHYRPEDLPNFNKRWGTGPDFSCFAVNKETLDLVGPFDETFDPCYFEDNDYHYRIQLAGFEALSYAPYWHYGSSTLTSDPQLAATFHPKFNRCKAIYTSKWGGEPGGECFTRPYDPSSAR